MNHNAARFNRSLALLVLASFTVFVSAVVLRLGIGATPFDTTDSVGRPMGFNDPLHAEHYLAMVRNFNPTELLKFEYIYEWVLFGAHILGAGLLISSGPVCSRRTRWFFATQALIFPFGLPALIFLPSLITTLVTGHIDREGFVDIPFILAVTQPVWVVTSIIITVALRGPGLGLSRVWNALKQATSAAGRTFVNAMR